MRDIPFFTAAGGSAMLVLREIPYKKMAYVILHSAEEKNRSAFFLECMSFCRAAGAEKVLLCTQQEITGQEPLFQLLRWERQAPVPTAPAALLLRLIPVTEEREADFLALYNVIFGGAPSAATLTKHNFSAQTRACRTYLAEINGQMAGVGQLHEREIRCIGLLPQFRGNGMALMTELLRELGEETAWLQATSDNAAALRLYTKMGFSRKETLSHWYDLGTMELRE